MSVSVSQAQGQGQGSRPVCKELVHCADWLAGRLACKVQTAECKLHNNKPMHVADHGLSSEPARVG